MKTLQEQETPRQIPIWLEKTKQKLENLKGAGHNWDSYGGLPLRADIYHFARRLLDDLSEEDLPVPAVSLGSGGNVQFEWHLGGRELEVELIEPESLGFLKVHPDGTMDESHAEKDVLPAWRDHLRWLKEGE